MRWTPGGTSNDIEDRRDESGGGGGGFGFGGMRLGLGGLVLLFILSLIFKQNFFFFIWLPYIFGLISSTSWDVSQNQIHTPQASIWKFVRQAIIDP